MADDKKTLEALDDASLHISHTDSDEDTGKQAHHHVAAAPGTSGHANDRLTADAAEAIAREHALTVRQALRSYRKAIFWSFIVSMAIVMEAYDTLLLGAFWGYPAFQKKYGKFYPGLNNSSGGYQIEPEWQVALSNANTIGLFFGCLANGWLADRFGRKRVMQAAYIFLAAAVFMMFFAPNIRVLFGSFILVGLPQGVFAIMASTYACEVCPVTLRPYAIAYTNLCWVIGHLIASGVLDGLVDNQTAWAYKIPFAIQWAWPAPLFVLMFWCPESPWWLVRKNRLADAERSLKQLCHPREWPGVEQTLALMVHTNAFEIQSASGGTWAACFRGSNLRRTEVSVLGWALQNVAGFVISGSTATYFFEQAGLDTHDAYKMTLGIYAVNFVGNIASWFLMAKYGRRTLWLSGYFSMGAVMLIIGILGCMPARSSIYWAQAVLLLVWFLFYSFTLGPLAIVISGEVPAARQRAKSVALARDVYYIIGIINQVVTPYMLNPTAGNLKGKAAFLPFGLCMVAATWGYFRLPELKGRTYEELDIMFDKRIPTREFKNWKIEVADVDAHVAKEAAQEIDRQTSVTHA